MKDKILAVKEFHKSFKLDYLNEPTRAWRHI